MCEKFQIVGSLLRPQELLAYKKQIEQRDDITYPFYNDFEGYEQVELASIQDVVKKEIENNHNLPLKLLSFSVSKENTFKV